VLGFKNLSGRPESAWLSAALGEMLGAELAAGETLRRIPGEVVARSKLELALPDADSYGADTLARLRDNLGADLIVVGSYLAMGEKAGGRLRVDLQLQDTRTGESVAAMTEAGTEAEFLDLVSRSGVELRRRLGVAELSEAEARQLQAALPSSTEAARLYAEGLEKFRLFDALGARELLEKAVSSDPRHALAHAALAEAWSVLGYDAKATQEAKLAFERAANLSQDDRRRVESRYRELDHDWDRAIELSRALFTVTIRGNSRLPRGQRKKARQGMRA
jgi:TolB-like protein